MKSSRDEKMGGAYRGGEGGEEPAIEPRVTTRREREHERRR